MGTLALKIEAERCRSCPGAAEPPCVRLCPGDLLERGDGAVRLRDPGGCWDCASCVKACPCGALSLVLPSEIGGRGSELTARTAGGRTRWTLRRRDGREDHFETGA